MQDYILSFFERFEAFAVVISLISNIIIAVLGIVPSVFVTGANVLFFGFWQGTFISFIGEALGAIIAFSIYRKGFKKAIDKRLENFKQARKLIRATGKEAFLLIVALRLLPFVPSGIVTLASAVGKVSMITFAVASTTGKLPAMLLEAFSVYQVTENTWIGKALLLLFSIIVIVRMILKKKDK